MTTKAKIFTGLLLSSVLATGTLAACNMQKKDMKQNGYHQSKMMKEYGKSHMKKGHMQFRSIMKQLNLSDEQKEQMKKIVKDARQQKETLNDTFTESTFDKQKFIKIMSEKRENMIKSKADTIEKMYAVLDTRQKEQFKTLLELKTEKMQNRFK